MAIALIDQATGEILPEAVKDRTLMRAISEWGGEDFPQTYWIRAKEWAEDRARSERLQWRDIRGLPREEEGVLTDISTWTDTFRRAG